MKNNLFLILLFFLLENVSLADELIIEDKNIKIDKKNQISILKMMLLLKISRTLSKVILLSMTNKRILS